jgi:hypothetical protein
MLLRYIFGKSRPVKQHLALSLLPQVCKREIRRTRSFPFGDEKTVRALFIIVAGVIYKKLNTYPSDCFYGTMADCGCKFG